MTQTSRWTARLAGAGMAWALFKDLSVRLYDPDLWWHLAAGREMIHRRAFLTTDIFSHTLAGTPWINFEWLSQVVLYGLFTLGGPWMLFWMKLAAVAAVLGVYAALFWDRPAGWR